MLPGRERSPGIIERAINSSFNERTGLTGLTGIGPRRLQAYADAGVRTLGDLLFLLPKKYVAFEPILEIASLEQNHSAAIHVTVRESRTLRHRKPARTRLQVEDSTGVLTAWVFGHRFLDRNLGEGKRLRMLGKLRDKAFQVSHWWEPDPHDSESSCIAQYALPEGIAPRLHRRLLEQALEGVKERWNRIPVLGESGDPMDRLTLYRSLHFPQSSMEADRARRTLALGEAIRLQKGLARLRALRGTRPAYSPDFLQDCLDRYQAILPFSAHAGQRRVVEDCLHDLTGPRPMTRLLSGEVGAGKTAVALFPLLVAAMSGKQGALLAPTEILAIQHAEFLKPVLERAGLAAPLLLSGKRNSRRRISSEQPVIVGTHRLLSRPVKFEQLAAVVVDEQHKFGVRQRFTLWAKGDRPDLLMISATPIPRTLSMTRFGHLDHSILALPPERQRRVTSRLLTGDERAQVLPRIEQELAKDGRVLVVCPAIGGVPDQPAKMPAAVPVGDWLRRHLSTPVALELLHGKMESEEKAAVISRFARGESRVLVTTVVVEVGVDVPDASMVVILGAGRFGLSQLHQIRGRVGRRGQPAQCLLVSGDPADATRERLEMFCETDDGFRLAQEDLELRGPGQLEGFRQHGLFHTAFPEVLTDESLMKRAQEIHKSLAPQDFDPPGVAPRRWIW